MGMNTVLLVRNDFLHKIRDDKDFGEKVARACSHYDRDEESYRNEFQTLPTVHADTAQIVVAGANTLHHMGFGHWRQSDEDLLKTLADSMGFRLVRKPVKKT